MNLASLQLPSDFMRKVGQQAATARQAPAPGPVATPAALRASTPSDTVPLNLPDAVTDWLASLSLLYGVPFEYLVPDIRLLPVESIRFFYIDPNWIRRLIDGAFSIGTTSTRENIFNAAFYEQVYAAVLGAIPQFRQKLRGAEQPDTLIAGATTTGFLFRSAAVSGYPGMEVVPTAGGVPVPILRLERLSSDIMLALFNGVPDHIDIRQPPEGLHFGVVRNPSPPSFTLHLRWVGHTTEAQDVAGNQIYPSVGSPLQIDVAGFRSGAPDGVLDVTTTANAIIKTMGTQYLGPEAVFTSAEFAIEMVLSAGVQPYDVNPGHSAA